MSANNFIQQCTSRELIQGYMADVMVLIGDSAMAQLHPTSRPNIQLCN